MSSQFPRIAIVDDDASVRRALSLLLDASSFEVAAFRSGAHFLQSLRQATPQCLIVDLQMPGMTGLELLHHLAGAGISIPAIAMTAYNESGAEERCIGAGARAFLLKPIQEDTLIAAVTAALDVHGPNRRGTE